MNKIIADTLQKMPYTNEADRQRANNLIALMVLLIFTSFASMLADMATGATVATIANIILMLFFSAIIYFTLAGQLNITSRLAIGIILLASLAPTLTENPQMGIFNSFGIWFALVGGGMILKRNDLVAITMIAIAALSLAFLNGLAINEADLEGVSSSGIQILFLVFTAIMGIVGYVMARNFDTFNRVSELGDTRRQLILTQTTNAVVQRIFTRVELQTLLTETVDQIRDQFEDIYHAQVFLIEEAGKNAVLRASTGEVGQELIARKHALGVGSASVIGQVTAQNKPVLAGDTSTDPTHKANELLPETLTELAIPLRGSEGVIGALDVQSLKRNAFSLADIELLQSLADQIAVAVEHARAIEDARAEAEQAKALADASQLTSQLSVLEFEDGLADLFDTVLKPRHFSHWWLGTYNPETKSLQRVFEENPASSAVFPAQLTIEKTRNSLTEAVQSQKTLHINDPALHPAFEGIAPNVVNAYGKHIVVPILKTEADTETTVGVFLVGRPMDGEDIGNREVALVESLTNQINIALENQRLVRELQNEQQTLESILATMPTSIVAVNANRKVILANDQAHSMFGEDLVIGGTLQDAFNIFRTGTGEPYPQRELPVEQVLSTGKAYSAEDLTIERHDGLRIDVLAKAAPNKDADGNVNTVIVVYQDITELRELERALQESLSETTKLYEASRAISHATSVSDVADGVANQMLSLSPSSIYMTVQYPDQVETNDISLVLSWPQKDFAHIDDVQLPRGILLPDAGLGTTNLTFATQHLHLIPGIEEAELQKMQADDVKALAVLPLEARGQVFGAIIGLFKEERNFNPEERRFLLTLADQTAVALDAVISFERTQRTLQTISQLYQTSQSIAEVQDVEDALQIVQNQIMQLNPDRLDIVLSRDVNGQRATDLVLDWSSDNPDANLPIISVADINAFDMLTRDEFFIEDLNTAEDNRMVKLLRDSHSPYSAVASLPFQAGGQPTGRMTVGFTTKRRLSQDDRQFLRMLADSTALHIENDILFKQTQDSLEETGILYQAIRAFANTDDQDGILQAIIDYAADPAVDKAMLCMLLTDSWDSPNALMEVVVSWVRRDSVDLTGMRFTAEQFPSWEQISTPSILWVDDVMHEESLDETARMGYRALDISSFIIIPLKMSHKSLGAILLGSSEPRVHSEREVRIYQSLADQAAITMENKRLFDEAESRARQLATSAQVSQSASTILQIDELLPQIVDLIKESFGYDQVQVFLMSQDNRWALLQASTGEPGRQLLEVGHKLERGSRSVIGQVTEKGEPQIALDTADARVVHKPNPYLPNTRSEMAIPLISRGTILGALDVQSNQPGAFTESDVRVLSVLADQLAVAIENASLFELSEKRTNEMGFLFEVTSTASSKGNLNLVLDDVSQMLARQLEAELVTFYLYDETSYQLTRESIVSQLPSEIISQIPEAVDVSAMPVFAPVVSARKAIVREVIQTDDPSLAKNVSSGIYVPLLSGDALIGCLGLESTKAYQFNDDTLSLLQTLTGSLSAVIQNSRLVQDLQTANVRLREIDKLKTNFLAAMSHELRTPLNSIIGFSRVILKGIDGPITDMQSQDLQTIHDSGKHLLGLVNDILDQAKIEAGKMELSHEFFDLEEVIKGVMSSAVGFTKEKPIRLYTEIEAELPQAYGDEFRTRQVLLNLISNAAKFTDEGSITTSANVIEAAGRRMIQVSVTDTGTGIRAEDFDKLFESFQQVDNSTTRSAEGTGLGLPLARSLTELQGGRIWVESEYGVGSTFSITIPVDETVVVTDATEPDTQEIDPDQTLVLSSNGNSEDQSKRVEVKTVIVIEDNVDLINLLRRHLSHQNYDVIGVTKADDVEPSLMKTRPFAIVLNVDFEAASGWGILTSLREKPMLENTPIITHSLHEADAERSKSAGANVHLTRPVSPDVMVKTLKSVAKEPS